MLLKMSLTQTGQLAMFFRDVRPSFQRSNGLEFYLWKERFLHFFNDHLDFHIKIKYFLKATHTDPSPK